MENLEDNLESNITNNNNGKSSTSFNHLLEIQNLVKKESALKELCKKELFNL